MSLNLQVDQLDTECICAEEFLSSTLSNIVVLLTDVLERNLASVIRTYLGEGFSITIYNKIIKPKPAGLKTIILTESCFLRNCLIIVQVKALHPIRVTFDNCYFLPLSLDHLPALDIIDGSGVNLENMQCCVRSDTINHKSSQQNQI
jgi:hypothetical protein